MAIKCLLFDSDGTLVDSEYWCNLGLSQQFATLGVTLDTEALVRQYRGAKLSDVFNDIAQKHEVTLPSHFLSDYRQRVSHLFDAHLKPVSGVIEALEQLDQVKAVVSNGPREKIEHALGLCNLQKYFKPHIFSAYDVGSFKPDPAIYQRVASELGFAPSECVVIEDSIAGVTAGSNAKIQTLFYNTFNETVTFSNVTSFNDMKQLPELIVALS